MLSKACEACGGRGRVMVAKWDGEGAFEDCQKCDIVPDFSGMDRKAIEELISSHVDIHGTGEPWLPNQKTKSVPTRIRYITSPMIKED